MTRMTDYREATLASSINWHWCRCHTARKQFQLYFCTYTRFIVSYL